MRRSSTRTDLDDEDRLHFDFALGKALEDAGDYAESFEHYARRQRAAPQAPCLRRADDTTGARAARARRCSRRSSSQRARAAARRRRDPIFIVGLPRAGSTLLEQILASHSAGRRHDGAAGHLPPIARSSRRPGEAQRGRDYPAGARGAWTPTELRALGEHT